MIKKITACILSLQIVFGLQAQQHLVDSLLAELKRPLPDSSRAMSMMRLAIDYEVVDTTKAYEAYRAAISFATEKKLYYQLGRIFQNQAALHKTAGNYQQAIVSLDKAIANYQRSDHYKAKLWEANAYNDKANSLKLQNKNQQAADYYLKGISLLEAIDQPGGLVSKYANLAILFGDMNEKDKQVLYAHKALLAAKKLGVRQDLFMAYYILANAYAVQEDNLSAKKFLDSATMNYDEAENADNIDILIAYYMVAAQVNKNLGKPDSALHYFTKAYEVSRAYNYGYGKAETQVQMGAIATVQKNYALAEKYLLAGIREAKALNYYVILDEAYKYLSDVYAATNRYKEAYEYYQDYKAVNDSVLSMESRKYTKELEEKYESAKKDRQIFLQHSQLTQRKTLNGVLIVSAIIMLAIILLLYRNYKQEQALQLQRINELETEKQLAATEAVLKGEEQERSRLAKELHDGLGGMLSGIKYSLNTMKGNFIMTPENIQAFERSMDLLDSSIKEMRRVAHNMMPEALVKFGLDTALRDFCNDVNSSGALIVNYQSIGLDDKEIDQTTAVTIYRIVQELLNNTMKHASAKSAIVQLSYSNSHLSLTVEDDGKGFDTSILKRSTGIGWDSIKNRVEFLKGQVDIASAPGKGTSVHIELTS